MREQTLAELEREIRERVDAAPEALAALAGLAAAETPADTGEMAARLGRLIRERDGIGPVNLVAESEAAETEAARRRSAARTRRADRGDRAAAPRHRAHSTTKAGNG